MSTSKNQVGLAVLLAAVLLLPGCASTPTKESTGQYVDSAAITAKVKAKLLQDSMTSAYQIDVTTYKDRVQLSGFVNSQQERDHAVQLARSVPGVKAVDNNLILKGQP